MSKLWLVAQYEYRRHVLTKGFIMAILAVPLFLALSIGAVWLSVTLTRNDTPLGYVDQSGLLADPISPPRRGGSPDEPTIPRHVALMSFETQEAAQAALESGKVQAYYVVTADYVKTNRVELVYIEPPDGDAQSQFWDFMQINRLTDLPLDIARRAVAGSNLTVRWPDDVPGGGREFSQSTFFNIFLPLFVAVAVVTLLLMGSGYLMGALAEEKENRMMEMLVTSLSPVQLIGGKVLAVVAIGLTQMLAWAVFAALAILVGGHVLDIAVLQNLSLDLRIVAQMIAIAIPTYVMIAAAMTAVGATVVEVQEAQQVMGVFVLPFMIPLWLMAVIIEHPNSPLTFGLSFFPVTALPTLSLRMAFAQVPLWQIALSATIQTLSALGALWLAGRAFRLGMLRYGQRLNWRALFHPCEG